MPLILFLSYTPLTLFKAILFTELNCEKARNKIFMGWERLMWISPVWFLLQEVGTSLLSESSLSFSQAKDPKSLHKVEGKDGSISHR